MPFENHAVFQTEMLKFEASEPKLPHPVAPFSD
jgi:hypothetical protein